MKSIKFKNTTIAFEQQTLSIDNSRSIRIDWLKEIKAHSKIKDKNGRTPEPESCRIKELRGLLKTKEIRHYYVKVFLHKYNYNYTAEFKTHESDPNFRTNIQRLVYNAYNYYRSKLKYNSNDIKISNYSFNMFTSKFNSKGRVFAKPGQIYEKYIEKKVAEIFIEKKPITQTKYIGLEIEFCAPIAKNTLALKLYNAGIHKFCQMKEDGSLRPKGEEVAYELALLLKESTYKKDIKKVCKILKEVGAMAEDRRCGLHVHLDMRSRNKEVVYSNLVACQSALLSIVHPSRIDNEFCESVDSRKFPTKFTGERKERYKTINAAAFYRYKTLEIRMHQGSIEYIDIVNWMGLLIKIANYNKKMKLSIKDLTVLSRRVKLDKKVTSFFQDKSCYWQLNQIEDSPLFRYQTNRIVVPDSIRYGNSPAQPSLTRLGTAAFQTEINRTYSSIANSVAQMSVPRITVDLETAGLTTSGSSLNIDNIDQAGIIITYSGSN